MSDPIATTTGGIELSVIVPLFNEEECIRPLHRAIVDSLAPLGITFEILFVDDGSRDNTFSQAREIASHDPHVRVIKFRKNYGQTPAMSAGIDYARGHILVTMDGDLQNDPRDIPMFLDKIREGSDIVCGWRHKRQDKLISRRIPSVVANWLIGKITGVPIKDNGCSLKAYRAEIIKSVPLYSDMHRFIPAMTSLAGTKVTEIKVSHHPRRFGVSKYGISRIYKVVIDLLVIKTLLSFATKPLRLFSAGALLSFGVGSILAVASFVQLIERTATLDFMMASGALLFLVLSFFFLLVGLLCELVLKTGNYQDMFHLKTKKE